MASTDVSGLETSGVKRSWSPSCLHTWVRTFSLPRATISRTSDFLLQLLFAVDPCAFTLTWKAQLPTQESRRLRTILNQLIFSFRHQLGLLVVGFELPDISCLGEENFDQCQLHRFLQLILAYAVYCDSRESFISNIMSLDIQSQEALMSAISEVQHHLMAVPCSDPALRCEELETQLLEVIAEKNAVLEENEKLRKRIQELEGLENAEATIRQLRARIEEVQRESERQEACLLEVESEKLSLEKQLLASTSLVTQNRRLQDELDSLRERSVRVEELELTVTKYKQRMEEYAELKKATFKTSCDREDIFVELKKQVEQYGTAIDALQKELMDSMARAEAAERDLKETEVKVAALEKEKEALLNENQQLRLDYEELRAKFSLLDGSALLGSSFEEEDDEATKKAEKNLEGEELNVSQDETGKSDSKNGKTRRSPDSAYETEEYPLSRSDSEDQFVPQQTTVVAEVHDAIPLIIPKETQKTQNSSAPQNPDYDEIVPCDQRSRLPSRPKRHATPPRIPQNEIYAEVSRDKPSHFFSFLMRRKSHRRSKREDDIHSVTSGISAVRREAYGSYPSSETSTMYRDVNLGDVESNATNSRPNSYNYDAVDHGKVGAPRSRREIEDERKKERRRSRSRARSMAVIDAVNEVFGMCAP